MLPNDAAFSTLCGLIYGPTALIDGWDHIDLGADDGIYWATKKFDGYDVVVFRGSITLQDWIDDLRALPIPTRIGHVHAGFYTDMEKVWNEVKPMLTQPVVVTGHSLGAARASVLCGLMKADGVIPARRVVFGEPKPGLLDFAQFIKDIPGASYRNGDKMHHDYVTDVPLTMPPLQFVHALSVTVVTERPTGDIFARMGIFAWHHIQLYEAALTALFSPPKLESVV
jgi:Lipase (class 3)